MKNKKFAVLVVLIVIILAGLIGYGIIADNQAKKLFTPNINLTSTLGLTPKEVATINNNIRLIASILSEYYTNLHYYPTSLSPQNFNVLGNMSNITPATIIGQSITTPHNIDYQYIASPIGCTLTVKNCHAYSLRAKTSNGKIIDSISSSGGQ